MSTECTLATFNCENLFRRFRFRKNLSEEQLQNAVENGFIMEKTLFEVISEEERTLTAQAIKATKADILALQEVESMDTLKNFNSTFMGNKAYPYKYLMDGNDPRLIDVAVLSRIEADYVKTHQFVRSSKDNSYLFSRDCLELGFTIGGKSFTLFVNHFKSMMGGRDETKARREEQAKGVVSILKQTFGDNISKAHFAVVGDLNDYKDGNTSLKPLLKHKNLENVIERLPAEEQWTHWWDGAPRGETAIRQLDYIFLSSALAAKNSNAQPLIVRNGLAAKAPTTAKRFEGVGNKRPAASDHCPVAISLKF